MIDTRDPGSASELDKRRVVAGRHTPETNPVADIRGATTEPIRQDGGAAEPMNEETKVEGRTGHGGTMSLFMAQHNGADVPAWESSPDETALAIGRRLRLFRHAMNLGTVYSLARAIGAERNRLGNYELGMATVSTKIAARIARLCPSFCLHWLYTGDPKNLSIATYEALKTQAEKDAQKKPPRAVASR